MEWRRTQRAYSPRTRRWYDFGIVEQGEGIHNRIRNLPATSQGKRSAMIEINNGKGVFIRTGPASHIYEMTGA
eukprot:7227997-Prymnesium_polylepis.1